MKIKTILLILVLSVVVGIYNLIFGQNSLLNFILAGWIISMILQLFTGLPLYAYLKDQESIPKWFKPYSKKINPILLLIILLILSIIVANATTSIFGATIVLISLSTIHLSAAKLMKLNCYSKNEKKLMINLYVLFFVIGLSISLYPAIRRIFTGT